MNQEQAFGQIVLQNILKDQHLQKVLSAAAMLTIRKAESLPEMLHKATLQQVRMGEHARVLHVEARGYSAQINAIVPDDMDVIDTEDAERLLTSAIISYLFEPERLAEAFIEIVVDLERCIQRIDEQNDKIMRLNNAIRDLEGMHRTLETNVVSDLWKAIRELEENVATQSAHLNDHRRNGNYHPVVLTEEEANE